LQDVLVADTIQYNTGWPDKMVAEEMVRTKCHGQNGIRTKWYWTK